MSSESRYHRSMRGSIPSWLALLALFLAPALQGQGMPPSVTSLGFGGSPNPPGLPPSVTSLRPDGFAPPGFFFGTGPPAGRIFFHRHHQGSSFGGAPLYLTPYYYPPELLEPVDDSMEEYYGPGPTIFDRRSLNRSSLTFERQYDERLRRLEEQMDETDAKSEAAPAAHDAPAREQPATVLVYRDGHTVEITNYAIVGDLLYDFSSGPRHKIALADLDLTATQRKNDDRGVDFRLPSRPSGN
jgi:hypothetical protein